MALGTIVLTGAAGRVGTALRMVLGLMGRHGPLS